MEKLKNLVNWYLGLPKRGKALALAAGALLVIILIELSK